LEVEQGEASSATIRRRGLQQSPLGRGGLAPMDPWRYTCFSCYLMLRLGRLS